AVVASAQNADLLYLQHIVALHVPVPGGRFATELLTAADGSAVQKQARAVHRAAVRGRPAPHRRIHSDVLVFAQPHEYEPLSVGPHADATREPAVSVSVWTTAQTSPAAQRKGRYVTESTAHPAKMLPAVAAHAINHYTEPGDLVLDPMCGIGTTLVEAVHAG